MSRRASQSPFDLWVGRELRRSYDATLAEPVPHELLRLLDLIEEKT